VRKDGGPGINPVAKFACLIILAVFVFLLDSVFLVVGFTLLVLIAMLALRARAVFKRGILFFAITILLAHVLFVRTGAVYLQWWKLVVAEDGIRMGMMVVSRFLSVIMMSWIFVSTTRPRDLSTALSQLGVPYRYSHLIALAMRFVPVFRLELSTVRDAQAVRGMKLGRGLSGIVRSVRYTTMPMLYCALSRINTLAASMEGRGFGQSRVRTYLHPVTFRGSDLALVVFTVSSILIILWAEGQLGLW